MTRFDVKLFISWSGDKGRVVAEALRDWIRLVLQGVDPFISTRIEKGDRWLPALARQLDKSHAGIVVVTRDSLDSRWLHFEAGALSKIIESVDGDGPDTAVWTYLVDVSPTDVEYPLAQFQHSLSNPTDTLALLESINRAHRRATGHALGDDEVRKVFNVWWPELGATLQQLDRVEAEADTPPSKTRPDRELIEEVLELVRGLHNREMVAELATQPIASEVYSARTQSEFVPDILFGKLLMGQRESKPLGECWVHFTSSTPEGRLAFVEGLRSLSDTAVVRDLGEDKGHYTVNIITADELDQEAVLETASRAGVEVTIFAGVPLGGEREERH